MVTFSLTRAVRAAVLCATAVATCGAGTAAAQDGKEGRWGLRASFTPQWAVPEKVLEIDVVRDFIGEASKISGGEFTIGVLRGSRFGGDWGLSYFRKTVADSTRIDLDDGETCISVNAGLQCAPNRTVYTTSGAALHGVELYKFLSWGTIKRRVQIGNGLGLGALTVAGGSVTKDVTSASVDFNNATRQLTLVTAQTSEQLDGKSFLKDLGVPSVLPTLKLDFGLTAVVTRNVKLRATAGVHLPGVTLFSASAIYLFGR